MWTPFLKEFSVDSIRDLFRVGLDSDTFVTWGKDLVLALLILAAFWGLSRFVRYFLAHVAPRITKLTRTGLDDRMLVRVAPPVEILVILAGFYLALRSLALPERVHLFVAGAVFVANVAVLTNIGYRMTDEFLGWYARRVGERTGSGIEAQIFPLVRKVFTVFLTCAALIVTLRHFRYDVLSLVTAMGIGSLAIGLAAKDTLANMISGFTLMIDRPFRIGDRIELTTGKSGDVVDIGLRSTKIRTPDNTLLIIPNSELCNSTVLNMTLPDLKSQGRIAVGVNYGSDVDQVRKIMVDIAMDDPDILRTPPPEAFFLSFGDNALNMTLLFWVLDYAKLSKVTDRINSAILVTFAASGIQIPYPTRKVLLEREIH